MSPEIRRIQTVVEEVLTEASVTLATPVRRATCTVVIRNPYAGRHEPDLSPLYAASELLSEMMVERLLAALGVSGKAVEGFGKAALIGAEGEMEHGAALMHPRLGTPVRAAVGPAPALIPSSKKRSGPGAPFDVPLGHKLAAKVRSHFDGIEVRIHDAPRADEIALALAFTTAGRPLPRVGGLPLDDVKGEDGLT